MTPPPRPGPDRTALLLTAPAQAFAGHAEDHWINVVTSRAAWLTPLRVPTVFFKAVMFPLHCYPHIVLLPRVSYLLPSAHKEFAVEL